jgi:hypothetical protein
MLATEGAVGVAKEEARRQGGVVDAEGSDGEGV